MPYIYTTLIEVHSTINSPAPQCQIGSFSSEATIYSPSFRGECQIGSFSSEATIYSPSFCRDIAERT